MWTDLYGDLSVKHKDGCVFKVSFEREGIMLYSTEHFPRCNSVQSIYIPSNLKQRLQFFLSSVDEFHGARKKFHVV
jgi:hypothetical protein